MVAPVQLRSPESAPERAPAMSALDRVLRSVRSHWKDYTTAPDASTAAQARFSRRIANGDVIDIDGEIWRIIAVTKGDDGDPVIIENGKVHRSIASLDLERVEKAAPLIRSVEAPPAPVEAPAVVATGAQKKPAPTSVTVEYLDDEPEAPVVKRGVPLKLRYGAVDVSEAVEDRARDTAEESLHAEKRDAGFFAKIFKHNIAYEVYRQIAISRSRSKILNEKNLYASDNFDRDAHRKATGAVVDRFLMEHEEFLHGEGKTAEKKKVFGDSTEEKAVKKDLEALVREYATNPEMDAAELAARKDAIFASASKLAGDAKGRGVMYADNLDKIAEQVRQQAAHAGGLANLDLDLEITLGKAKLGARTERDRNLLDRALDGLQRYGTSGRIGSGVLNALHNEVAIALGTAWVVGGLVGRAKAGAAALATFGTSMLVTGAYSAYKEKSRLGRERSLHERQMALGGETKNDNRAAVESELREKYARLKWWNVMERHAIEKELEELKNGRPVQPRRAEMEKFALARESAKELAESVRGFLSADGKELRGDVSVAQATDALADIEARVRVSNRERIDLLKYTSVAEAEVERLNLDVARASLKAALRKVHDGAFSVAADKKEYASFQEYYNEVLRLREGALYGKESAVQKQHRAFAKWSNTQALKRGASTMVIGAGIGLVGHELWALGTGGETTIGSMWSALKAYFDHAPVAAVGPANVETIGTGMFTTPAGTDLVPQADGSYVLESVADHRAIASGLRIDAFGNLDAASKVTLEGAGANILETDRWVDSTSTVATTESTWDWLRHHGMQKIHVDHWMDNDTRMHLSADMKRWLGADLNELKLEWGGLMGSDGVHPSGLDSNGNIVMTMANMTPDGSFHNGLTENAPAEIVERKVRLLLTMNGSSQNSAIEIISNQRGEFHIDPNSDIGKTFFRVEGGKVIPLYDEAKVGISKGFDAAGVNHFNILATAQGEGVRSGITSTNFGECIDQHVTQIGLPSSHEVPPIVIPPFVPITRRQPMEPLKVAMEKFDYNLYQNSKTDPELEKMFEKHRSETLKNDPNAELNAAAEIDAYFKRSRKEHVEVIRKLADELGEMGKDVRLSICIPAAGHQEGKNIYESLKNYTYQTAPREQFEIVVFVNRPEMDPRTNAKVVPDETMSEIVRFKKDHPELQVRVAERVLPVADANIANVRKLLNDAVAMRQLDRSQRTADTSTEDVLMVSNDADNKGVAPEYVANFIKKFKEKRDVDGMLGQLDWDPEAYVKFPLIHAGTRLFQYLNALGRWRSGRMVSSGANFAFRAGMYAAVGGYRDEMKGGGEDIALGRSFIAARKRHSAIDFAGARVSRVYTSARRAISALRSGIAPVHQWEKGFSAFDDEVRRLTTDADRIPDYSDPVVVEQTRKGLEAIINQTLDSYEDGEIRGGGKSLGKKAPGFYQKALGWMGIQYELDANNRVVITNMDKFVENLRDYQDVAVPMRDAKAGKDTAPFMEAMKTVRARREVLPSAEDIAAEVEMKARARRAVEDIDTRAPLMLSLSDAGITPERISASPVQTNHGSYTFAEDVVLSDASTGRVLGGVSASGMPIVGKESDENITDNSVESSLVASGFDHPNVLLPLDTMVERQTLVRVYEAGRTDLEHYLEGGRAIPVKEAVGIMLRVCDGVRALHDRNIVHTDIAPSNIILWENTVRLGDLDAAQLKPGKFNYSRGGGRGNRFITPPELLEEKTAVSFDKTVDIYESAASLFRMIEGRFPYYIPSTPGAPKPEDVRRREYLELHRGGNIAFSDATPESLRSVIRKAMDPTPKNRYQSMEAFMADLAQAA